MSDFLVRLLIGATVIFIVAKVVELLGLNPDASKIINALAIIGAVVFIVFGSVLRLS